ncbi:MAG TPA: hypothetical protein PKK32_02340 [Candidatus Paceibacterota bacterium]|nr:hypothetical protein [Candidatus Paceibacterota bacterium]
MKLIFLFLSVIYYMAGQGVLDFVQVVWQKESCCLVVTQGSKDKREFSVLLEGQRDTRDLIMRADTILKIDPALFKEVIVALE